MKVSAPTTSSQTTSSQTNASAQMRTAPFVVRHMDVLVPEAARALSKIRQSVTRTSNCGGLPPTAKALAVVRQSLSAQRQAAKAELDRLPPGPEKQQARLRLIAARLTLQSFNALATTTTWLSTGTGTAALSSTPGKPGPIKNVTLDTVDEATRSRAEAAVAAMLAELPADADRNAKAQLKLSLDANRNAARAKLDAAPLGDAKRAARQQLITTRLELQAFQRAQIDPAVAAIIKCLGTPAAAAATSSIDPDPERVVDRQQGPAADSPADPAANPAAAAEFVRALEPMWHAVRAAADKPGRQTARAALKTETATIRAKLNTKRKLARAELDQLVASPDSTKEDRVAAKQSLQRCKQVIKAFNQLKPNKANCDTPAGDGDGDGGNDDGGMRAGAATAVATDELNHDITEQEPEVTDRAQRAFAVLEPLRAAVLIATDKPGRQTARAALKAEIDQLRGQLDAERKAARAELDQLVASPDSTKEDRVAAKQSLQRCKQVIKAFNQLKPGKLE